MASKIRTKMMIGLFYQYKQSSEISYLNPGKTLNVVGNYILDDKLIRTDKNTVP